MRVHMQRPFEPRRLISSHRSRRGIFGLVLSNMTLFFFPTWPCREASERVEASYLLAGVSAMGAPTIFDLAAERSSSSLPELT
jgi:hypothetical protein